MTELITLPIVNGGIGAGVDTEVIGPRRTVKLVGVTGKVFIEISNDDGVSWCPAGRDFKPGEESQILTVIAGQMRVNATSGTATKANVTAERGTIRDLSLPAAALDTTGASSDVSGFGCETTVTCASFSGVGAVDVEIAGEDVDAEYAVAFSFNKDGCDTRSISARFIRVVSKGATAVLAMAAADVNPPADFFVFRPGATGADAPGGNVYTVWEDCYEAIKATRELGWRTLEIDSRFSAHTRFGDGDKAALIPASIGNAAADSDEWDMDGVTVTNTQGSALEFADGCRFFRLTRFDGYLFDITYNGRTPDSAPFQHFGNPPVMMNNGQRVQFQNTDPLAAPMFKIGVYPPGPANPPVLFFPSTGKEANGGLGGQIACPAPLVDLNGWDFSWFAAGGFIMNNALTDTSVAGDGFATLTTRNGGTQADDGPDADMTYDFPALPVAATVAVVSEMKSRYIVNSVIDATDSPYTANYNELVQVDGSAGDVVVQLLPARSTGDRVAVVPLDGLAQITVVPAGTDTINGDVAAQVVSFKDSEFANNNGGDNWVSRGNETEHDTSTVVVFADTPYTAAPGELVRVDTTAGAIDVVLPPAGRSKKKVTVKFDAGANVLTVKPDGADTIDGAASVAIALAGDSSAFVPDLVTDWVEL